MVAHKERKRWAPCRCGVGGITARNMIGLWRLTGIERLARPGPQAKAPFGGNGAF